MPNSDQESQSTERPIVVYAGIASNIAIAVTKFIAAFFTGSSAMLAEAFHSSVDTGNELLLLLGVHRSKRPPDETHPFGHGQALYFWSLIVAIVLFGVGGGLSLYEGVTHLQHPAPVQNVLWSYGVISLAAIFEAVSWVVAYRKLKEVARPDESIWHALKTSKDPSVTTVLLENSAALLGLAFAFLGIFLADQLHSPYLDGAASVLIGLVLTATALFLAYQSSGLLVGKASDQRLVTAVRDLVVGDEAVRGVGDILTMQLGPHQILLTMRLRFQPALTTAEVVAAVDRIERTVREHYPDIAYMFVEADSLRSANSDT